MCVSEEEMGWYSCMYAHVYDVAICYNRLLVSDGLATPGSALKCSVKSVKNGRLASQTIVTRRPIDASIQRVYLLGFKELSFNILETRK